MKKNNFFVKIVSMNKKDKKYYISVFGCQMNKSDAERIETILSDLGFQKTKKPESADLIMVVACSVRQSAVNRIYGQARNWQVKRRKGKLFTILTGCVLKKDKKKLEDRFDLILDIKDINQLSQKLAGLKIIDKLNYFHIPPKYDSNFQAYVPIMTGCNNFCAYCVVPYVRDREVSRSAKEIIIECQNLIERGYREITLLGQNVNSYRSKRITHNAKRQKSAEIDFPELLATIDKIPGDYWLRFITSHPKDLSDDLIKVMTSSRHITPYLHLPVQSGNNQILKKMNRKYTVSHYLKIVEKARKAIPNLMISTDVIVGFPGETKKQFMNSVDLFKKVKFDMAYISQYSPRPQTAAFKLADNVSKAEKKRREAVLTKILNKSIIENNKKILGRREKVLVERFKNGKCIGKTSTSKIVVFNGEKKLVGKFIWINIEKIDNQRLIGKLISNKLIVVLGPTACGKTKLSAKLAAKFNGEIISADSRQVYKGMDIGTGKDLVEYTVNHRKIPYHLIDVVSPKTEFNVAKYQKMVYQAIDDILSRGKTPFLVGGSGLYIDAVIKGYNFHKNIKTPARNTSCSVAGRQNIRKDLDKLSPKQLLVRLKRVDFETYRTIDKKNRRRVQRALEIYYETGQLKSKQPKMNQPDYDILILGIKYPLEKIYQKIDSRLEIRVKEGMIKEVKKLHRQGVTWKRLNDFGLEYRWVAKYLKEEIDYSDMVIELKKAIHHFAKRQLTWFKRNNDIIWVDKISEAQKEINKFLKR